MKFMFSNKQWSLSGLQKLIHKIDETESAVPRSTSGSGRPRTARLHGKIEDFGEIILSQENAPNAHKIFICYVILYFSSFMHFLINFTGYVLKK